MSRGVQPRTISPLIKGARYTFLVAGFFYGVNKKNILSAIESRERPKREAALLEEKKLKKIQSRMDGIEQLKKIFEDFGIEPEPGWEDAV